MKRLALVALALLIPAFALAGTSQYANTAESLGNTTSKTVVWVTSSAATSAAAGTLVLSSRTVTAGKTFFIQHIDVDASWATNSSTNTTNLGSVQFLTPTGSSPVVVSSQTMTSGFAQPTLFWKMDFAEPVPILTQVTFAITVKPNTATATQWTANIIGYER